MPPDPVREAPPSRAQRDVGAILLATGCFDGWRARNLTSLIDHCVAAASASSSKEEAGELHEPESEDVANSISRAHEIAAALADRLGLDKYRRDAAFGVLVDFETAAPSVSQQETGERDALVDGILWRLLELPPATNATVRTHAVEFASFLRWLHRTANERASVPSQQKGGGS